MPIGFLTAADRARLNRFPEQIPHEDLSAFFLLSEADHGVINQYREAHMRLGFALQLCALRYLGFAPDDLQTAPATVVEYVAQQLAVTPQDLAAYGTRRPTRTTHFQQVQIYLHFRLATPLDLYALQTWLGASAAAPPHISKEQSPPSRFFAILTSTPWVVVTVPALVLCARW